MTDEEKREKQKNHYEEMADPKWKANHVGCFQCGYQLYAPHPGEAREHEWGQMTFLPLLVAYMISKDWAITEDGGKYLCPRCAEIAARHGVPMHRPISSAVRALPHYEEWIQKMRDKFSYYLEQQ